MGGYDDTLEDPRVDNCGGPCCAPYAWQDDDFATDEADALANESDSLTTRIDHAA